MISANRLIDKAKDQVEGRSYAALARHLGVTPQTVHQWKTGDVPLPTERIVEVAKIAHLPVDEWTLRILSEQSKGEARRVLEGVMKKIGYVASVALCAIGFSMATPENANAISHLEAKTPGVLPANAYYVKGGLGLVGMARQPMAGMALAWIQAHQRELGPMPDRLNRNGVQPRYV